MTAAKICFNLDGMFGLREGCCMDALEMCTRYIEKALNESGSSVVVNRVAEISLPAIIKDCSIYWRCFCVVYFCYLSFG